MFRNQRVAYPWNNASASRFRKERITAQHITDGVICQTLCAEQPVGRLALGDGVRLTRETPEAGPIVPATRRAERSYAGSRRLGKRHVQILNRLVDLARALVAYRHAIDARLPERKLHRLLPVLAVECALADELHRDYAHSFVPNLPHVLDDLGHIP